LRVDPEPSTAGDDRDSRQITPELEAGTRRGARMGHGRPYRVGQRSTEPGGVQIYEQVRLGCENARRAFADLVGCIRISHGAAPIGS
jgi:hypothetical protein